MKFIITVEVEDEGKKEVIGRIMALSQEVKQFAQKVDTATSAIAQRIEALMQRNPALNSEDQAEFQRIVTQLEELGKHPESV